MIKVAVVHDYLTQRGGAERVALSLAKAFDGSPVYTSLYSPGGTHGEFRELDVRTTFLQGRVPPSKFRSAAPLYPLAFRSLDLRAYDAVVVSTSGFAHHVDHPNVLVYCHTPPRFLHNVRDYREGRPGSRLVHLATAPYRASDVRAMRGQRAHVANSAATAGRMSSTYGIEAAVVYPPLHTAHLPETLVAPPGATRALMVARLLPYKRADLAIRACAEAAIPLTLVGDGPQRQELEALAAGISADVTFLGRVSDAALREAYVDHSLVLLPGREDFGYIPVEANYAGRPIIAHAEGGALETVRDGVNGLLVAEQSVPAWSQALLLAARREWDPGALRLTTGRFSEEHFIRTVQELVGEVVAPSSPPRLPQAIAA